MPRIHLVLFVVLCALLIRFYQLRNDYVHAQRNIIHENVAGMDIFIYKSTKSRAILHLGDVLGTNTTSAQNLKNFNPPSDKLTHIIIPSILPKKIIAPLNPESFLRAISNERGVIVVDNFCFDGWEKVQQKEWYSNTSLTPGPYCLSESETQFIDRIIKQYKVQEVRLYADNVLYPKMITSFLKYLDALKIKYKIIQNGSPN